MVQCHGTSLNVRIGLPSCLVITSDAFDTSCPLSRDLRKDHYGVWDALCKCRSLDNATTGLVPVERWLNTIASPLFVLRHGRPAVDGLRGHSRALRFAEPVSAGLTGGLFFLFANPLHHRDKPAGVSFPAPILLSSGQTHIATPLPGVVSCSAETRPQEERARC